MTNQKKEKNKFVLNLLILFLVASNPHNLIADEKICKKFDIKCKSQKWIDETKNYQKKKLDEGMKQYEKTKKNVEKAKDKVINAKDEVIEKLPKKN